VTFDGLEACFPAYNPPFPAGLITHYQ